jgi:hypothetical protein
MQKQYAYGGCKEKIWSYNHDESPAAQLTANHITDLTIPAHQKSFKFFKNC